MKTVQGTPYFVAASPIFGSTRWRFEITAKGAGDRFVLVTASRASYATEALALDNGEQYARAMQKKLAEDLR